MQSRTPLQYSRFNAITHSLCDDRYISLSPSKDIHPSTVGYPKTRSHAGGRQSIPTQEDIKKLADHDVAGEQVIIPSFCVTRLR